MLPIGYYLAFREKTPQNQESFLAKWIPDYKEEWAKRNALHTEAVEQAGTDRTLLHNSPRRKNVELRSAE